MNVTSPLPSALASAPSSSPAAGATASNSASSTSDPTGISDLATQGTFITLLVAQLENQDPLNPTDSTTFVTQLAQFTQVDQMVGIAQNVQTITNDLGSATGANGTTTHPTTGH